MVDGLQGRLGIRSDTDSHPIHLYAFAFHHLSFPLTGDQVSLPMTILTLPRVTAMNDKSFRDYQAIGFHVRFSGHSLFPTDFQVIFPAEKTCSMSTW